MWGTSWTIWTGALVVLAVIIAAASTIASPIFAIVIVVALIPFGAFMVVSRTRTEEAESDSRTSVPAENAEAGGTYEARSGDAMVSDRQRAEPQ